MDKYEYKLKLDQMKALAAEGDYATAAEIAEVSAGRLSVPHVQMGEYTWQVGQDGHLSLR